MIDPLSIARILIEDEAAAQAASDELAYMEGPRIVHVDGLPDEPPALPPPVEEIDDPRGFFTD